MKSTLVEIAEENVRRNEIRNKARGELEERFNLELTSDENDHEASLCYPDGDGCCQVWGNIAYGISSRDVALWMDYCSTDSAVEHIAQLVTEVRSLRSLIDFLEDKIKEARQL